MNKKSILVTIVWLTAMTSDDCLAQRSYSDSLKTALSGKTAPLERFDLLNQVSERYVFFDGAQVDSAACIQMLQIAQQLNNDSLLAISYNWIGSFFTFNNGDNALGLEYYFKAIPLAERAHDKRRVSSLYFDIALSYFTLRENEEAVKNNRKGAENLPDKSSPKYEYMLVQYQRSMAKYYLFVNKPDSALFFANAMLETGLHLKSALFEFNAVTYLAEAYEKLGDSQKASTYFRKAFEQASSIAIHAAKQEYFTSYIRFLIKNNRLNEAHQQSKQLFELGVQLKNDNLQLSGAGFMRQVYEAMHKIDSAYYYSRVEAAVSARIFSESNTKRVQALAFGEQLRNFEEKEKQAAYQYQLKQYALLTSLGVFSIIAVILYRNNRQKQKSNKALEQTLSDLKATQSQLIQSEKMASLGELTAGIAHEIQNPLNFVNNFSEVNTELIDELQEELKKGKLDDAITLSNDIKDNEQKINHHGKRADAIVKGMLQHSRSSSGIKEPTDINALADEYLRLAYHGLRAKDKSFNATVKTDFDPSIGNINVIPQDIGRVILNLITNAFYEVTEKKNQKGADFEPTVSVSTRKKGNTVLISVKDNGKGIPQNVRDKIFQPFFTTKPTGQGTGLGLSLSYDIVKAHGGKLTVETKDGEGSDFVIELPV